MNLDKAIAILGINRSRHEIQNMVFALKLAPFFNTKDDSARLWAGKYVLRYWSRYQAECNAIRDELWK